MNDEDKYKEISKDLSRSRRRLPHFQSGGRTLYVTWRCLSGQSLTKSERALTLDCIKHFHDERYLVFAAVVMPDHVHLLIRPSEKSEGIWWDLGELLQGMKGVSARKLNYARGESGSIWQDERYDRLIRSASDFTEKWRYIRLNAVRAELVSMPEGWDALWLPASADGYLFDKG